MEPRTTPTFTPARIVALALIGLAVLGLAWLRYGSGDDRVSVPKGAHAGQLTLHECRYDTEDGSYAADCGTLVVPENRADPGSRLIAVPVTRIRAHTAHPAEPIFRLEGGPGITNMKFSKASRYTDKRDVVLVGYRGVDGSVRLDCPEVESAVSHSTDITSEKSMRKHADALRSCAERLRNDGVDLAGYSMTQQVEDFEAARKALGYDRIDLVSESAGTRTALIYAWRHPKVIHRSVMIGANPPGHFVWDTRTADQQLRRYAELCAKDESCSRRTDDLAAEMKKTAADIPGSWLGLPIDKGSVLTATFYGLMETTSEMAPVNAPMTLASWLSAADGDASGFWFQSLFGELFFSKMFVWGEIAAIGSADSAAAREYFASRDQRHTILSEPSDVIWAGGRLAEAWPTSPDARAYSRMRPSNVETLAIGGELDFTTPPQVATKELMPYLPNGRQVILPGFGHSASFWTQQSKAGTRLVEAYLDSGKIDRSLYEPQKVDFTPEVAQPALAKGVAGAMVGLALLTVISLLAMARRVHKRGHFGHKTGAMLRSVYPIVLGLGGWFAGILIVITTMPGVALDDELLATLSVALPVGLGIYLAWLRRERPLQTNVVGLAVSTAGAVAGAWLGFHAANDLLALLTAIAGATAAANLMLILLDMSRAQPVAAATAHTHMPELDTAAVTGN